MNSYGEEKSFKDPKSYKGFCILGETGKEDRVSERPFYSHTVCDTKESGLEAVYIWAPKSSKGKGELLACLLTLSRNLDSKGEEMW